MGNDLVKADGKLPTLPTWVWAATTDTWLGGDFSTGTALACLTAEERAEVASAAQAANACLTPMDEGKRKQRLTATGMVMAPNRPPAEATMWLHEVSRLLADVPGDLLCAALDQLQCTLKFLPTVAEIRELVDPEIKQRRLTLARLDAMRRFLEKGYALPTLQAPKKPLMDRRGEPMTEAETDELNGILEKLGAIARYRPDGSRYTIEKAA